MLPDLLSSRFRARVVPVGTTPLGGDHPVRVQSMTNTDTLDTLETVKQAIRMATAGCEYIRIATPGVREAENLKAIKKELHRQGFNIPLIADVHFNPKIAEIAAAIVEKVRINPGNYTDKKVPPGKSRGFSDNWYDGELDRIAKRLKPLLDICKSHGTAIRIGTNHGSLSDRIMNRYGDTPEGMVESALEFVRICSSLSFHNLVLSMKASNPRVMIRANRLLVERMITEGFDYPIHLGVTEAGEGEDGRLKSAVGIGSLLVDGIGNTIRVSLTEDPENEIPVAYGILQASGARKTRTEFISCPSCARTLFNIQETTRAVKSLTAHLKGLKIAVMGCIVNGPGEMADADYGYIGAGKGKVMLYRKNLLIRKNVPESLAINELIELIRENGDWTDP